LNTLENLSASGNGVDAANLPLTFALVDRPLYGTLSGTAPDLVYTPGEGFVGQDRIRFTVSNGSFTSRPGQITIQVKPSPNDKSAPTVLWTLPAANATVEAICQPRFTGNNGPINAPVLLVQFSKAMDRNTLTPATLQVRDSNGRLLNIESYYDVMLYQASILLREPLQAGQEYTVTVTRGAKDASGNALAADHTWRFRTQQPGQTPLHTIFLPSLHR
jgi:hypothetical protein